MRPGEETPGEATGGGSERPVTLEVTQIRPWGLTIVSVGVLLLGVAAMVNAVDDWFDSRLAETRIERLNRIVDEQEVESDCRASLAATVSNLESERSGHLAAGLVAVVREDDIALDAEIAALGDLELQLKEARQDRANAVEICNSRPEDVVPE